MRRPSRLKRWLIGTLTYAAIVVATLAVLDGVLILSGLFPPRPNPGDPDLGWRSAHATGRFQTVRCTEFASGETFSFERNEDGIRTTLSRASMAGDSGQLRIAVIGDSQTDLCAPNSQTHAGVLESVLLAQGARAVVLNYGAGRYSPLQDYLAYRKILRRYRPTVLVLNLYTGNDLYDILRVDDRPHLAQSDTGYRIAPPVWYLLDDPGKRRYSRVLFALRSLADKLGIRGFYIRVKQLRQLAAAQGVGPLKIFRYLRDLWRANEKSLGYPAAFAAQMLNQQLFFHHFPGGREESIRRLRALMRLAREENPGLILVMSPLPSYQLAGQRPVDEALLRTFRRLPLSYEEGVTQEEAFYQGLRSLSTEEGWLFVDNLAALRDYRGSERLYNSFDYHLLPVASAIIGRAQAAALHEHLRHTAGKDRP